MEIEGCFYISNDKIGGVRVKLNSATGVQRASLGCPFVHTEFPDAWTEMSFSEASKYQTGESIPLRKLFDMLMCSCLYSRIAIPSENHICADYWNRTAMGVDEPAGPILLDGAKSISSPHKSKLHDVQTSRVFPTLVEYHLTQKGVLTTFIQWMNPGINESNHSRSPARTPETVKIT